MEVLSEEASSEFIQGLREELLEFALAYLTRDEVVLLALEDVPLLH
jgi:hypothetical protein